MPNLNKRFLQLSRISGNVVYETQPSDGLNRKGKGTTKIIVKVKGRTPLPIVSHCATKLFELNQSSGELSFRLKNEAEKKMREYFLKTQSGEMYQLVLPSGNSKKK